MCGIVGFTGASNSKLLKSMNTLITHRGPDDEGYYSDGEINLAMRRLSIIDLATGHQPMTNEDQTVWVVYNGEIYNFKKIRDELIEFGHVFATSSDTETIIHAYEQWGDDCVDHFNGMFAIAIWNKVAKKLILYRDRMGIKPLFYCHVNNRLLFASEIKSLLINPDFTRDIDFESLHHYFSYKNVPAPKTIFKNISTLCPGEKLVFENNTIKRDRYWQLTFNENHSITEEDASEHILKLLDDSVRMRMVADVPIGAYLSGGLDSSTVVALLSKHTQGNLKTFSLGYEDDFKNKTADLFYARKVSKLFGTDHHEYIMSAKELPEDIHEIISSFSEPFSGVISTFYLSKLIAKHVKVAISGDGADELFGSYLAHRLANPVNNFMKYSMANRVLTDNDLQLLGAFKDNIDFLKKIASDEDWKWRAKLAVFNEAEKSTLYSDSFKSNINGCSSNAVYKSCFDTLTATDPLNRILECDEKMLLPDQVLAFVDRLSMAHSIEVRPPFLDYRLVEFAATLHGSMKIKDTCVKYILKKAVKDLLPDDLINRPKEGFVLPVNQWILTKLDSYIKDTLSPDRLKKHNFFNVDTVTRLLQEHFSHRQDHANKLWNLVCFQIWFEIYYERTISYV